MIKTQKAQKPQNNQTNMIEVKKKQNKNVDQILGIFKLECLL